MDPYRDEWLDVAGQIYGYQPTMYPCKVMIGDGVWVSVGSTKFDDCSFHLNDEAHLNIYDAGFAAEEVKVFDGDKRNSGLITGAEYKNRSAASQMFDEIAGTLRRQL